VHHQGNGCLIAPKVFEPVRCQLGVTHRVLNVSVPEPSLQRPRVVASVLSLSPDFEKR
jgi:hypothetical protein